MVKRRFSRPQEAGITLIELMIVVAIVGILAGVAVFMFGKSSDKVKVESETAAVIGEFKIRQQQYQLENGSYLATGAAETDVHPAGVYDGKNSLAPIPATWTQLKFTTSKNAVRCGYVVITGDGGDDTNIGPIATSMGVTVPATDWYYVLAECDSDGDSSVNAYYLATSVSDEIAVENPGR